MAQPVLKNAWNWKTKVCHVISNHDLNSILRASFATRWASDNKSLTIGLNLRFVFVHPNRTVILQLCSNRQLLEYSLAETANGRMLIDLPLPPVPETTDAELCGLKFTCVCGKSHLTVPDFKPTAVKLPLVLTLKLQGSLACPLGAGACLLPAATYPYLFCDANPPPPPNCLRQLMIEAVFQPVASSPRPAGILAKLHGGLLPDATLRVGVTELRAHRGVLAASSDVFRAMFENGRFEEARGGFVDIADVRVEVMEAALRHAYGQALGELGADVLVEVLVLAERYQLLELKALCEDLLSHDGTLDALQLLAVADSSRAVRLKDAVINRIIHSPNRVEMMSEYSVREIQRSNPAAFTELFLRMCRCGMPQNT